MRWPSLLSNLFRAFSPWVCLALRHVDGRNVGLGFENGQRHGKKHSFSFFLPLLTEYRPPPLRFLGMKRAPQPLALLQSSYRVIDKSMIKMACGGHLKE
jgi:hypothetical protein